MSDKELGCFLGGLASTAMGIGGFVALGVATGGVGLVAGAAAAGAGVVSGINVFEQAVNNNDRFETGDYFGSVALGGVLSAFGGGAGLALEGPAVVASTAGFGLELATIEEIARNQRRKYSFYDSTQNKVGSANQNCVTPLKNRNGEVVAFRKRLPNYEGISSSDQLEAWKKAYDIGVGIPFIKKYKDGEYYIFTDKGTVLKDWIY